MAQKKDDRPTTAKKKLPANRKPPHFHIVGIGASAGGLEALETLLKALPANSGAAFIIVVHLDPKHVSLMPELLQKHTKMPVAQIVDGTKVQSNHVYIIPPNKDLCILGGTLQLLELIQPRGRNLPIDNFLRSLAQDQGDNAIGIILSGTGSDGTIGMKEIKAELGMTMVQAESSAKYYGMPHSAIATGIIDFILPAEKMPKQLIAYLKHSKLLPTAELSTQEGKVSNSLQKIFVILRARTSHDFSLYKKNTIFRRIERRMNVHQIDNIVGYVRYLQESDSEADLLFKELLIGVTNFFRDPDAFESLRNLALMEMFKGKPDDYIFRVWVAGCSSGEEAYSIAIQMLECMESLKCHYAVQIFSTDIDESAIATARNGLYPASILTDVSEQRLKRFFTKEEDGQYRIKKAVREMLVFAPQSLIKDPPFTKLDLLCCRNLLIYLGPELQKKLLPIFHYSLKPGGIMFLGSSESIGQSTNYFKPLDKKWKIFRAISLLTENKPTLNFPMLQPDRAEQESAVPNSIQQLEEISAFQLVETILQQSDAPPCAIINEASNILYIHGKTGRFLEPAEGKVNVNIIEMARSGLKKELAEAIRKVSIHRQDIIYTGLKVECNGGHLIVDLLIKPILGPGAMRGMIMVIFDEVVGKVGGQRPAKRVTPKKPSNSAVKLEEELHHTRENLKATIEELETSNEELKSTNEELQSTNEELQSTNEEMETSKEELQSLNEESATVNAELQSRIDELTTSNDDMKNLFESTNVATVFLDIDLCIRNFTPAMTDLIPLSASDMGRPLKHFATDLVVEDLTADAQRVLNDLSMIDKEVVRKNGLVYRMRLRPYRTVNNVIDGVVITFDDITNPKRAEKKAIRERRFAESIVNTIRQPLLVLDKHLRVVKANPVFYRDFAVSVKETEGALIYDLGNRQWDIKALRTLLEEILPSKTTIEDYRVEHTFEGIGKRTMMLNARKIKAAAEEEEEEEELILLAIEDISQTQH